MADGTRSHSLTRLEEAIALLTATQSSLHSRLDDIASRLQNLESPSPSLSPRPSTPRMHLDVPRFDGSNAPAWVFKINQFFDYHRTPEDERLQVASFYLDGEALCWFQWLYRNDQLPSWSSFLQALEMRFAPSMYDDPRGALCKLTQTGTVNSYLAEFEALANRIVGLPTPFLLSCFISGLTPEIRRDVLALQPLSLVQAAALARLQEDKLTDSRRPNRTRPPPLPPPTTTHPPPLPSPPLPPLLPAPPRTTYKRLSPAEMANRRERGLCYNCDERYSPTHRCRAKFFLLVATEDDDPGFSPTLPSTPDSQTLSTTTPSPDPTPLDLPTAQLSLHALSGHPIPSTLRVRGSIHNHELVVLVDGGSTHNFIHHRLLHFLRLTPEPIPRLTVMVGDGTDIDCTRVCRNVTLTIQEHQFIVDLHVMGLGGADLILGVAWLTHLGPITSDYSHLTMRFSHQGKPITIYGDASLGPSEISHGQVKRLVSTHQIAGLFHLQLQATHPITADNHTPPSPIRTLLSKYPRLFQPLHHLPPSRSTDHIIHLEPHSKPVNVRPYRYPYFQKIEIEKQVQDMLHRQLIRPSRSPYSSPVLLVKKKDGTWRFCVDYRALNSITIKDRFPLPTIDELLDDLGNSSWFSKMDLPQGFHQIRMSDADIFKTAFRTHEGHYEYVVMPFGLCNAPSTFQATMNSLFRPFIRKFVLVFFDDILVYSSDLQSHLNHLDCVLRTLQQADFRLKASKCIFGQRRIEYLGHFVSRRGVEPDSSKIQAMLHWPPPTTTKALCGFLGLTGFYCRFVKNYAQIAAPLTHLLKKDQFVWTPETQQAFEALKSTMTTTPVLALPDFNIPFTVETDASGSGMGAVLMQRGHPLAFFSKQFCPKLLRSST